jgi:hypothetical protein
MCIRCGRNWQTRKITAAPICFHTSPCFPFFDFVLLFVLLPECVRISRSLYTLLSAFQFTLFLFLLYRDIFPAVVSIDFLVFTSSKLLLSLFEAYFTYLRFFVRGLIKFNISLPV